MTPYTDRNIEDSWIINDTEGDGDISWAEDTDASDVDEKILPYNTQTSPKVKRIVTQRSRTEQLSASLPGPEFIMPSLGERSGPPRSPATRHAPRMKTPDRHIRYVSHTMSPTPARSANRKKSAAVGDKVADMAMGTGGYILDVVASTLRTLKKPISWVLAAYLFAGLLVLVQNLLTSSITSALTPVCRIPGVSLLHLPICRSPYASSDKPNTASAASTAANPEFDALMAVQGKFETVLEDSSASITLPLEMKRGEISIRDLRQVVHFSSIPSKNELLHEFDGFIETARIASYDLQKFNSHVGRAVDIVLSTARWTQRILDDMSHKTTSHASGMIVDFINNRLLSPFQPLQFTESRLLSQYITHTRLISDEIERLIEEAQALLRVLKNLEDRLDVIHSISIRDNLAAKSSRDEILGQLWTYIGGNRAKLGKVDSQMRMLAKVGQYRKLAYAHVAGTILKLQAMNSELEELRTRVGSAEMARDRGIEDVPLSVHIENIRLGVERLEGQREKARQIETGHVQSVLKNSRSKETLIREGGLYVGGT